MILIVASPPDVAPGVAFRMESIRLPDDSEAGDGARGIIICCKDDVRVEVP